MSYFEHSVLVQAPNAMVFDYLDDHRRLISHMGEPSSRMGGGRMTMELDADQGRAVGSRIRLAGRVCGLKLSLEEVVTERESPHRKTWQTIGTPRLLIIGHYRMGFELSPAASGTTVRAFIDYALPEKAPGRWLGQWFAGYYARWCVESMVNDAKAHFERGSQPHAAQPQGIADHGDR